MKAMHPKRKSLEERFWANVTKTATCWNWTGPTFGSYGVIWDGKFTNKKSVAHRIAYKLLRGPIPNGLVIDHLCSNPVCVNPDHLEAVTSGENIARGFRRKKRMGAEYVSRNLRVSNLKKRVHAVRVARDLLQIFGRIENAEIDNVI